MPDRVAEEVVKKYVRMTFDPGTKELIQVVMPFVTKTEVMTLTVDKGWVTEASVEDIKLLPGVHRTMFRLQVMQQPSDVVSHLQIPQVRLHWQTVSPLSVQQQEHRPPANALHRFCSVVAAI